MVFFPNSVISHIWIFFWFFCSIFMVFFFPLWSWELLEVCQQIPSISFGLKNKTEFQNFNFLVHLDQRSRWTIAITWRLSSVNFSHFKLLLRNTGPIGTQLSRNVPWMVLYKVTVFRIFNMAAKANNMLWLAEN